MTTIPQQAPAIEFKLGLQRIDDRRNKRYGWSVSIHYQYEVATFQSPAPNDRLLTDALQKRIGEAASAYGSRGRPGARPWSTADGGSSDCYVMTCYLSTELLFEKRPEVVSEEEARTIVEGTYDDLRAAFMAEWAAMVRREYRKDATREAQHVIGHLAHETRERAEKRTDYDARLKALREELRRAVDEEARLVSAEFLDSKEPMRWKPEVVAFVSDPERLAARARPTHGFFGSEDYVREVELFPEEET